MNRPVFGLLLALSWLSPGAEPSPGAMALAPDETGRPLRRYYAPGELMSAFDSPRAAQLADGTMVFANGLNVATFDGAGWDLVVLPSGSAGVRQFARADDGTMYMAGAGVIGYLARVAGGWSFVSLADHLPAGATAIDELRSVATRGEAVYFADCAKILIWREGAFRVVPYPSSPTGLGAELHRVGDEVLVSAPGHGLARLAGDAVAPVADAPVLREQRLVTVVAGAEAGTWVVLTAERGFWLVDRRSGTVAPWVTPMNRWLAGKRVFCARRLVGGEWVVGFSAVSGDGGARFYADGRYAGPLDTTIGLAVSTVRGFFEDAEGGLWLGLDTGSARLVWPSAFSLFDATNGLGYGAVGTVRRRDGELRAVTTEGEYRLVPADGVGRVAHFERLTTLPEGENEARSARGTTPVRAEGEAGRWEADEAGIRLVGRTDHAVRVLPQVLVKSVGAVASLFEEPGPDGPVLWVAGTRGLARVDVTRAFAPLLPLPVQVEVVGVEPGQVLPPRPPPLWFSFVAPRQVHTAAVEYQTRLADWDRDWSDWSPVRERSFAMLPAGRYRFEVRARDADGVMSPTAAIAFAVRSEWWASGWAIAGYAGVGLAAVAGLVRGRTAALRRRAKALEATVAARTADLARSNVELVRLHGLELDEKITARLAEEKARLETLRYQLNPHFLFNSLASISATLPTGDGPARLMVERLAEFCRLTLYRGDDEEWTTVGGEMRLVGAYLEIERMRWGELLDVAVECPPELEPAPIPYFLLLPLVENALKYGRATSPDRVGLVVRVRRGTGAGGDLVLEVGNTGTWLEPARRKTVVSLGIGLDNLRQRLARHYPGRHRLDIAPADGWVWVALHLQPTVARIFSPDSHAPGSPDRR